LNQAEGPAFKLYNDPRVTRVGRILRKASLDELPQLWHVLAGDMSLVGPRPPFPEEVERYESWMLRRLAVRPGLTCLWQIRGRSDLSFDEWMRLDIEYVERYSLPLDVKILVLTIPAVLSARGAY
jgi:lipopolysaccharide/colanic/teichoic acid biosynthesis glycosyltransferase